MLKIIRKELHRLAGSVIFYSRIPLPSNWFSEEDSYSSRYFSLLGWIAGGACVLVWMFSEMIISGSLNWQLTSKSPEPVAVLMGLIAGVLLTGALHEDGLADTCDGFGHGGSKEEKLRIMKDSRIGTYGALGILLIVLLKFFSLLQIETELLPWIWISGHSFSRFLAISQLRFISYVHDSVNSKSRAMSNISKTDLAVNLIIALLPMLLVLNNGWQGFIAAIIMWWVLMEYFRKKLGGINGDCMGSTQQLTEVVFYIFLGSNVSI